MGRKSRDSSRLSSKYKSLHSESTCSKSWSYRTSLNFLCSKSKLHFSMLYHRSAENTMLQLMLESKQFVSLSSKSRANFDWKNIIGSELWNRSKSTPVFLSLCSFQFCPFHYLKRPVTTPYRIFQTMNHTEFARSVTFLSFDICVWKQELNAMHSQVSDIITHICDIMLIGVQQTRRQKSSFRFHMC